MAVLEWFRNITYDLISALKWFDVNSMYCQILVPVRYNNHNNTNNNNGNMRIIIIIITSWSDLKAVRVKLVVLNSLIQISTVKAVRKWFDAFEVSCFTPKKTF
jgi:hypothetical protein